MICIKFNGKKRSIPTSTTLRDFLLESEEQVTMPFAVAINREFIPQAHYDNTILRNGDELELVTPMQGG